MGLKFGIVAIGYNNVVGMGRLLSSLSQVDFQEANDVTLIISIDFSGSDDVEKLAQQYEWSNGSKIVIAHKENLGLRKHILSCGDYMEKYNLDAVAVLEDDIYVSPAMYSFMKNAVEFYREDDKIAGISLYKHETNLYAKHPFYDYDDGGDTFFIQYAQSWGQIWIREKWKAFIEWYEAKKYEKMNLNRVPLNVQRWKNSWLKYHIMYCIDQSMFFVYPRISLTTNYSDVGTHNTFSSTKVQVKIQHKVPQKWYFNHIGDTRAVYDAFFESVTLKGYLGYDNLSIDLFGVKPLMDDIKYTLTRKTLPYKVIKTWGLQMRPIEDNIFLDIPGNELVLYEINEIKNVKKNKEKQLSLYEYDLKGVNVVSKNTFAYIRQYCFNAIKGKIKKKIKRKRKS